MDSTNVTYRSSQLPWNKSDINYRVKFVLILRTEQNIWSPKYEIFLFYLW